MRPYLHLAFATFSLLAIAHAGCSPAAPAESPQSTGESESPSGQGSEQASSSNEEGESGAASSAGSSFKTDPSKRQDDRVPYDRSLTNNDCNVLGKQFAATVKADLMLEVPAKLKGPQRDEVVANIEEVARKKGGDWTESCQTSLVGQVVDEAAIKCAAKAPTAKDFDACLNATLPPKK